MLKLATNATEMETKIEHKSVVCSEVKATRDDQHLYIEGYGARYGNVDSYADIIEPGAFAEFLASDDAKRAVLCWQHDFTQPIGAFTELSEDESGLRFKAVIANTQQGRDAAELIESGVLSEFSIGYGVVKADYPTDHPLGAKRLLKQLYLYEISLVTRAANPEATLEGAERKGEEEPIINQKSTAMEEELKNQIAELEAKVAEAKADKESIEAMKESIANLDESIKLMHDEMKENKSEMTAQQAICNTINSDEFKNALKDVIEGKRVSAKMEVKIATSDMTGSILRTMGDTEVNADAQPNLAFLGSIRRKDVPQDKSYILWLEGSFTNNTNYVNEGSAVASADAASVSECTRMVAKIAAKLPFTREVATDLSYFLNWARAEAIKAIQNKVDSEILSGSGADTNASTKKLVYGIIGQGSTAFSASTAGLAGAFTNPCLINLIDAIDAQVSKATNDAFYADTIYINPSDFAKYKNMKTTEGALVFENNGGIYTFMGKRVVRTNKLSAGALIVADSSVFDLYEKLGFEIEIERVASTDSYVMYLRWRGQVVVPSNKKKAVIYVASIPTALAAITASSGSGSGQ